jgi:deoxycytidylate deaminase
MDEFPWNVGYFRLAKNVSHLSNCRIRVGCVLAKKTVLMACSNKEISHPEHVPGNDFRKSIHAEVRCLIHTSHEDLDGAVIFVYRETKDGCPALAKPCLRCEELLRERGVKKVYYSVPDYPFYEWERI